MKYPQQKVQIGLGRVSVNTQTALRAVCTIAEWGPAQIIVRHCVLLNVMSLRLQKEMDNVTQLASTVSNCKSFYIRSRIENGKESNTEGYWLEGGPSPL